MPFPQKLKILVAPLDWGLGHTTRCIPIIAALLENGVEVLLGGNEVQQKILSAEFPNCRFLPLNGYEVAYSKGPGGFLWKMAKQFPRIANVIKEENKWLQETIRNEGLHGVISDNRFGLYSNKVPCVFITHQLQIKTGLGSVADYFARKVNYRYINRFNHAWVPDFEETDNLAGELSHPSILPKTSVSYIGGLSRLHQELGLSHEPHHILVILSGPEPQRSILEEKIFDQIKNIKTLVTIVRGTPLETGMPALETVTMYAHVSSRKMEELMASASFIVCRSGYSSVMDINALSRKSILIPTPGQAEQEYLAQYLMQKQFALVGHQEKLNLPQLIENAERFSYNGFVKNQTTLLNKAVAGFLNDCKSKIK